jgi:hypothetical protein
VVVVVLVEDGFVWSFSHEQAIVNTKANKVFVKFFMDIIFNFEKRITHKELYAGFYSETVPNV